jgi:hypothetical protein
MQGKIYGGDEKKRAEMKEKREMMGGPQGEMGGSQGK